MTEGEEGAPDLLKAAAVFAQTRPGGQIQHPDAGDGEDDEAGYPGVNRALIVVDAGEEEAADHWRHEGQRGAKQLWLRRVGIGMVERHDSYDDGEQDEGDESVGEEPDSLAREVGRSFVLRDVTFETHVCLARVLQMNGDDSAFHYVFGGMCRVINTAGNVLSVDSLLE